MRTITISIAIAVILALAIFLLTTHKPSDTEKIRSLLTKLEQSIESKDLAECMSCISKDYSDNQGNTYNSLWRLAISGIRTHSQLRIRINNPKIKIRGHQATVEASLAAFSISPSGESSYRHFDWVLLHLEKERKEWKITNSAGWQESLEY